MNEDERRQRVRQIIAADVAAAESHLLADFLLARIAEDEADIRNDLVGRRWPNPGRSRAECEAKRRIVKLYLENDACTQDDDHDADTIAVCTWVGEGLFQACLNLAAVYADHPDYREEWRP